MELSKTCQIKWRQWLATQYGVEGMLYLRDRMPAVTKGQPHEIQFDAGFAMGYIYALNVIDKMIAAEPVKEIKIENE